MRLKLFGNFFFNIEIYLSNSLFKFLSILWVPFNFPELGVKGAAIGTLIATIWGCLHYSFYLFNDEIKNKFKVFRPEINKTMLKRQLIIAYPLAIQEFLVMLSLITYILYLKGYGFIYQFYSFISQKSKRAVLGE